ncbi:Oxygen-dependent coproporphyrinogen-III oxidase [Chlorella vulgaris]
MHSLPPAATWACNAAARPNPVAPRLNGTLSSMASQPRSAAKQRRRRLQATATDFEDYILDLQSRIIQGAEELDGSGLRFQHDRWTRSADNPNAGYGITSERARAMSSRGRAAIDPAGGQGYSAAAMSLVFHSAHPLIPTLRADVRLFEVEGLVWYGGGCDLTPFYLDDGDVRQFHGFWKQQCDKHSDKASTRLCWWGNNGAALGCKLYPAFKAECDRYFYIPARKEHRGVGGLFFDDIEAGPAAGYDVEQVMFVRDVGDGILPSWQPIVQRQRQQPFSEAQRQWQLLRRGRYLEFNLLYDRGVKFGLDGGRIEAIMVSAPPLIAWRYNVQPEAGSEEERLVQVLSQPRDWA